MTGALFDYVYRSFVRRRCPGHGPSCLCRRRSGGIRLVASRLPPRTLGRALFGYPQRRRRGPGVEVAVQSAGVAAQHHVDDELSQRGAAHPGVHGGR